MDLDSKLTTVAVVGAAGKMGSGITLLLAQEMARLSLLPENRGKLYRLAAIDLDADALGGLQRYVHAQAVKSAEKMTVQLRQLLADRADLVENGEIIEEYVNAVDRVVWPSTDLRAVEGAELVFEAIVEKISIKTSVYKQLKQSAPNALFFTNTSSVPIGLLDREAGLGGNIIGFHFYNPPPVQKLVEVIKADTTTDEIAAAAADIGKRLRKTLIPSNDVAGFIGNGHFIRDGIHGLEAASKLAKKEGWPKALYMVNRVSQDWLLRPMGIFQLIDYVGVDVFQFIQTIMDEHLDESLKHELIDKAMELGVKGGQNPDGSQKPGFLDYVKGRPARVYDFDTKGYVDIDSSWDESLGALPEGFKPWKALLRDRSKAAQLESHFEAISGMNTLGAEIARAYVQNSRRIGEHLVSSGVAASAEDVNGVLTSGFFHLYGPINDFCK